MAPDASFIHPTAMIEPGASVGEGTAVWHHSQVRRGAVIGSECTLGKNVFVDEGVVIGDWVKIQNNVSVYKGVELADEVFIGPSAVFTNDLRPRAVRTNWQLSPTRVARGASVGANATIVCGIEIGECAVVGAGAVVTAPVRPHQVVTGNPARHHGWVCACGVTLSRAGDQPAELRCADCRGLPEGEGLAGDPTRRIPLAKVVLAADEEAAVLGVLRSGNLVGGERVAELERSFARLHEVRHVIAVSNGTAALVAALRAHDIGPGDEVITSPLTFVATLNAILEVGAIARFADITDDLTLDPAALEALVTPRTRAVLPVHLYGLPAAMGGFLGDRPAAWSRRHRGRRAGARRAGERCTGRAWCDGDILALRDEEHHVWRGRAHHDRRRRDREQAPAAAQPRHADSLRLRDAGQQLPAD